MDESKQRVRIQDLDDLQLAVLLCLIAGEHCIIETLPGQGEATELALLKICRTSFGLRSAVVNCTPSTTSDDFSSEAPNNDEDEISCVHAASLELRDARPEDTDNHFGQKISNIIICKNADNASKQIQVQILELIRNKRLFAKTAMYTAPRPFLVIILIESVSPQIKLVSHLLDHIFISHWHGEGRGTNTNGDEFSGITSPSAQATPYEEREFELKPYTTISPEDLEGLRESVGQVYVSIDVKRYAQNIVIFLRQHRAVMSGITPRATRHLDLLTRYWIYDAEYANCPRCLAVLHNIPYVTPSLASLAVRKVYPHRICMNTVSSERSMQWGSDPYEVANYLASASPASVLGEVLQSVDVPL